MTNPAYKVIGNFKYLEKEGANSEWHYFVDGQENTVQYGGPGNSTDVLVRIRGGSVKVLYSRLYAYMKELVGRHGEELHEEGEKQFHGVTICLPHKENPTSEGVRIHTGSGCYYDQDEIAYEVMAALSAVPVYKAISPLGSCFNFERLDVTDDGKWITYWHNRQGIRVEFNHVDDHSSVVVSKSIHNPRSDWEKFQQLMYVFVGEYVVGLTGGTKLAHKPGCERYSTAGDNRTFVVDISSGSSFSFAVQVPYGHDFARLAFAKKVMKMLSKEFKAINPH